MTFGDWCYLIAWFGGAAWFGQHVLLPFLCLDSCDFCSGRTQNVDARRMNHFTIYAMGVGGLLSCISAGATAYFGRDPSGFWNIWVQDKTQVVKSLFTW
jgi:hypothetical protein